MEKKLYLVTGAAGFLGSNVCRELLDRGNAVRALVLRNDPAAKYIPEEVVGWYSRTKAMATQAVLDAVKYQGLNACVVHPSGILGPNDMAVSETTGTIIQIINGQMPVGMQGSFNLCDVRDLAHGCIMAAEKGRKGECYILGNEEVTLKELCEMLTEESGCKPIRFYLPLSIADFLAKIMERQAKRKGTKPLMTTFSVYNLARNNSFDYSKAEEELGYHTRSYQQTIHDEVEWLMESGKIDNISPRLNATLKRA